MSADRFGKASFKVIPLSASKRDWSIWSEKFLARADIKGYRVILLGNVVVKTDSKFAEIKEATEKKKSEIVRKSTCFFLLVQSMKGEGWLAKSFVLQKPMSLVVVTL